MASEQIGQIFPTQIPGYDDAADIQAALRTYHYGSDTYDINNTLTDSANLPPASIAGNLFAFDTRISTLEDAAAPAAVQDTEPLNPVEGYLWVNSSGSTGTGILGTIVDYQSSAPTSYLTHGRLWVKSGVTPLEMYVYNSGTSAWDRLI